MQVRVVGALIAATVFGGPAGAGEPLAAPEVKERILAVNRPTAPFRIVEGAAEGVDLVAEWRIVDAEWHQVFADAGLKKVFRIFMRLDETKHEVRAQDHEYTLEWKDGSPSLLGALVGEGGSERSVSKFKGKSWQMGSGTGYAFTEDLGFGRVYKYRFNTSELKNPIKGAVEACGWKYKGIAFGKP